MSLDWTNPNPWDTRYFDFLVAEYNKRKVFCIYPFRMSSGDYTTYRWRQSLLPVSDSIQDNTASANPNAWIFNRDSGAITQRPKMSSSNMIYNRMEPPQLGAAYQARSSFLEGTASRRMLRNQDIMNLFLAIAALFGPSTGSWKMDTFGNPNGGSGGYGYSMVNGIVNPDDGDIEGSSFIPNYYGCRDGQPMQQATLERYYTWVCYDESYSPQGQWEYNSTKRTPQSCPIYASPYSWPGESFREGKQIYSQNYSMYQFACRLVKDLDLDISSKAYSQGGPSMLLRACYLMLQKMVKFFSVWRIGGSDVSNLRYIYRMGSQTTQSPDLYWTPYLSGNSSYGIGGIDGFGGGGSWGYSGSSLCESYYNWDYPEQWSHSRYHLKSIMYHLFNPTPWNVGLDIYVKTAWPKADLSDFQRWTGVGVAGYNYKYATGINPSAQFGKYSKWSGLSTAISAQSSGYGIWDIDTVLDCPLPSATSDPANELCLPPISSIVAVYTPNFT